MLVGSGWTLPLSTINRCFLREIRKIALYHDFTRITYFMGVSFYNGLTDTFEYSMALVYTWVLNVFHYHVQINLESNLVDSES